MATASGATGRSADAVNATANANVGSGAAAPGFADDDGYAYEAVPEFSDANAADDDDLAAVVTAMLRTDPALLAGSLGFGGGGATRGGHGKAGGQPGQAAQQAPVAHTQSLPSVADDFIRNFLIRSGMSRSLDAFNTEWYELAARGALPTSE
jgi:hypothetical protein